MEKAFWTGKTADLQTEFSRDAASIVQARMARAYSGTAEAGKP